MCFQISLSRPGFLCGSAGVHHEKFNARILAQPSGVRTRDFQESTATVVRAAGRLHSSWRCPATLSETTAQTRRLLLMGATFLAPLSFQRAHAEDKASDENDAGLVGGLLSLFDPNEKTKSGRILPKVYLKNVRDVVKNLRESLKEDSKDSAKFRRSADSAKESIKDFMRNWTGQKSVTSEDSYAALVRAIRLLADFYSKKGPTAALSEDIKSKIMDDLNSAESAL